MINTSNRKHRVADPVRDLFNAVFAESTGCCSKGNAAPGIPLDIVERENEYELRASLPGFAKEDVQLEVEKGILIISANGKESVSDQDCGKPECCGGDMLRQERYAGSLQRSIKLPENIESSALRACLENGVLSITVGKPTLPVAHRIEIA